MMPVSGLRTIRVSSKIARSSSGSDHSESMRPSVRDPAGPLQRFEIDSRAGPREGDGMANPSTPESRPLTRTAHAAPAHVCERCGEPMEERKCKILCTNCGYYRDCSDP